MKRRENNPCHFSKDKRKWCSFDGQTPPEQDFTIPIHSFPAKTDWCRLQRTPCYEFRPLLGVCLFVLKVLHWLFYVFSIAVDGRRAVSAMITTADKGRWKKCAIYQRNARLLSASNAKTVTILIFGIAAKTRNLTCIYAMSNQDFRTMLGAIRASFYHAY